LRLFFFPRVRPPLLRYGPVLIVVELLLLAGIRARELQVPPPALPPPLQGLAAFSSLRELLYLTPFFCRPPTLITSLSEPKPSFVEFPGFSSRPRSISIFPPFSLALRPFFSLSALPLMRSLWCCTFSFFFVPYCFAQSSFTF